jgi:hypothetical protein
MIELDKWDSQFVYLAKNHFTHEQNIPRELEDFAIIEIAKCIWADRCGLEYKYVKIGNITAGLLKICYETGAVDTLHKFYDFIERCSPFSKYDFFSSNDNDKIVTRKSHIIDVFKASLSYLSMLQIYNDGMYPIIKLKPKEERYNWKNVNKILKEINKKEGKNDYQV